MYVFTQQSAIAIRKGHCLKWLVAQSKEAQSTGPSFALSAANYYVDKGSLNLIVNTASLIDSMYPTPNAVNLSMNQLVPLSHPAPWPVPVTKDHRRKVITP